MGQFKGHGKVMKGYSEKTSHRRFEEIGSDSLKKNKLVTGHS